MVQNQHSAAPPAFRWPAHVPPSVRLAGVFPLDDRDFAHRYGSASVHALHLHEYEGVFRIDGRDHALRPGVVTLSPARGWTAYHLPTPGRHWCVHFEAARGAPRGALAAAIPLVVALGERQAEAAARMATVVRHHAAAQRGGRAGRLAAAAASASLLELLLWLATLGRADAAAAVDPVDQLLDLLDRWLDRPLAVPELARAVGVSQNYLARRFRQRTGLTIPGYILRRRVERARLLLTTTTMPVKLVGARVGLPDPQHFNKTFRRVAGVSPSSLRRRR